MPDLAEARSLLREASTFVPKIEQTQQGVAASIAGQQTAAGDLDGALATVQFLTNDIDRGIAFSSIAVPLASRGDWRTALRIIEDVPAGVNRVLLYVDVASQLAERGEFKDAFVVAQKLRELPDPSFCFGHVLARICVGQWKAGDAGGASQTLVKALDAIEHPNEAPDTPRIDIGLQYTGLIEELAAGNPSAASVVLQRLSTLAEQERNPDRKQQLLGELSLSQALVGDFAAALRSAEQLPPGERRDDALLHIVEEQARQGDPAGARRLAEEMPEKSWTTDSLQRLAYALVDAGDSADALQVIDRIQEPGARTQTLALSALIEANKSDPSAAVTLSLAAAASQAEGVAAEPSVAGLIAETRAMLGDFPGSFELLGSLNDNERASALFIITASMVANGMKHEALALARAQKEPLPRANALLGIGAELMGEIEAANRKASAAR